MVTKNGIARTIVGDGDDRGPTHHVASPSCTLACHVAAYAKNTASQPPASTARHPGVRSPGRASEPGRRSSWESAAGIGASWPPGADGGGGGGGASSDIEGDATGRRRGSPVVPGVGAARCPTGGRALYGARP